MAERFRKSSKPLTDRIAGYFTWLHPNTITIIGFLLAFIPAFFFINGNPRLAGVGLLIHMFDALDGAVARITGKVSKFGEVLDATLDRVVDGMILFSIALGGYVDWSMAFFAMIGFYLVSYTRARAGEASAKKIRLDVGFAQRGERVIIITIASILYISSIHLPFLDIEVNSLEITIFILGIIAWETAIVRLVTAYKRFKVLKDE